MTRLGVVIPSAGRPALLDRCLRGIATNAGAVQEIVVIHDGDSETVAVVQRWADRLPLVAERGQTKGAAARRNEGWNACSAELIAFTDDDCEPVAGWAASIVTTFATTDVDLVTGPVLPHPEDAGVGGTFARTLRMPQPSGLYAGANLAVRRTGLQRVEGWDERLAGGEDTDLAWRVIESATPGKEVAWTAGAMVWHAVRPVRFLDHLRSLPRWSGLPLVVRRHPQVRRQLTAGVFWKPEHVTAAFLVMGLAGGIKERRLMLLALPHLWRRIAPHGLYSGTELVVSDLLELAVMITASARYGSLLL